MILVDTSAWVEYVRGTGSDVDTRVAGLIADGADIAVTEPVLMELLAGATDENHWSQLRRLLTSFTWIPINATGDFEGAATLYRSLRSAGITPRGLIDCMVAVIALRSGAAILATDKDFARIASVVPPQLDIATTT